MERHTTSATVPSQNKDLKIVIIGQTQNTKTTKERVKPTNEILFLSNFLIQGIANRWKMWEKKNN